LGSNLAIGYSSSPQVLVQRGVRSSFTGAVAVNGAKAEHVGKRCSDAQLMGTMNRVVDIAAAFVCS
jgi:hypothetical protein